MQKTSRRKRGDLHRMSPFFQVCSASALTTFTIDLRSTTTTAVRRHFSFDSSPAQRVEQKGAVTPLVRSLVLSFVAAHKKLRCRRQRVAASGRRKSKAAGGAVSGFCERTVLAISPLRCRTMYIHVIVSSLFSCLLFVPWGGALAALLLAALLLAVHGGVWSRSNDCVWCIDI